MHVLRHCTYPVLLGCFAISSRLRPGRCRLRRDATRVRAQPQSRNKRRDGGMHKETGVHSNSHARAQKNRLSRYAPTPTQESPVCARQASVSEQQPAPRCVNAHHTHLSSRCLPCCLSCRRSSRFSHRSLQQTPLSAQHDTTRRHITRIPAHAAKQ